MTPRELSEIMTKALAMHAVPDVAKLELEPLIVAVNHVADVQVCATLQSKFYIELTHYPMLEGRYAAAGTEAARILSRINDAAEVITNPGLSPVCLAFAFAGLANLRYMLLADQSEETCVDVESSVEALEGIIRKYLPN